MLDLSQYPNVVNSLSRLLDLLLCNVHCMVIRNDSPLLVEGKYYPTLSICMNLDKKLTSYFNMNQCNRVYNFKKGDYNSLYSNLLMTN